MRQTGPGPAPGHFYRKQCYGEPSPGLARPPQARSRFAGLTGLQSSFLAHTDNRELKDSSLVDAAKNH